MNYTLMHKDIPVVEIALDDGGTKITRVGELYHGEDLPVGVPITWDKAGPGCLQRMVDGPVHPLRPLRVSGRPQPIGFSQPAAGNFQKFGVEPFRPLLGKTGEQQPFLAQRQFL